MTTKSGDDIACITEESEIFNESDLDNCREFVQTLYAKIQRGQKLTGTVRLNKEQFHSYGMKAKESSSFLKGLIQAQTNEDVSVAAVKGDVHATRRGTGWANFVSFTGTAFKALDSKAVIDDLEDDEELDEDVSQELSSDHSSLIQDSDYETVAHYMTQCLQLHHHSNRKGSVSDGEEEPILLMSDAASSDVRASDLSQVKTYLKTMIKGDVNTFAMEDRDLQKSLRESVNSLRASKQSIPLKTETSHYNRSDIETVNQYLTSFIR